MNTAAKPPPLVEITVALMMIGVLFYLARGMRRLAGFGMAEALLS